MCSYICAQCTEVGLNASGFGAEGSHSRSQQRNADSPSEPRRALLLTPPNELAAECDTDTGVAEAAPGAQPQATFVTR